MGCTLNIVFLSYLEMICKNYQKYTRFQIVIPKWIFETLDENYNFMLETKKIIKKFYGIFSIVRILIKKNIF